MSYDSTGSETNTLLDQSDQSSRGKVEPAQNAQNAQNLHENDFSRVGGGIYLGRVVTSVPCLNWYLVHVDSKGAIPCSRGSNDASNQVMGVRDASIIAPHTTVVVAVMPRQAAGVILCSVPEACYNGDANFVDWISQGSNIGYKREAYYRELPNKLAKGGNLVDWGSNRPGDAASAGDWGRLSDLGGGVWVDSFMSFLRSDDNTGFWAFYNDQLARMSGHNLDVRSAGHEFTARDDEGEIQLTNASTPFYWEAMGSYEPDGTVHQETDDEGVHMSEPKGKYEPKEDDQQPFYRFWEVGGYLGQGHLRYLQTLPKEKSGLHKYDKEVKAPGLFWEQIGLDGSYSLASAKQVSIMKRALLPTPHRKRLPEDAREGDADNKDNYKASGKKGSGKDHKVEQLKFKDTDERRPLANSSLAMDVCAYLFGWQGLHPYHYHEKDFYLPKQDELAPLEKLQTPIEFDQLVDNFWLKPPEAKQVHIDHRYKDVDYYENTSGLQLLDDGGVALSDGYGSEIKMVGGNIIISCPGSLIFQTGRSVVAMAGDDLCLRARNSCDITAANKDVRIKAENNLQMLAANSGKGGMLFEVRSEGDNQSYDKKIGEDVEGSGVLFKVPHSAVAMWSKDIYLRTGSRGGQVDGGDIVLDADKGSGDILTYSGHFDRYLKTSAADYFGGKNINAVNHYTKDRALLAGSAYMGGRIVAQGGATFGGNINVAGGHIATQQAVSSPYVSPLKDAGLQMTLVQLQLVSQLSQMQQTQGTTDYQTDFEQNRYASQKLGNAELQQQAGFSYRNEKQYSSDKFVLPAARYQLLLEASGAGVAWDEPVVKYQAEELLPFPGKKRWKEDSAFLVGKLKLFQPEQGYDKPLGEEYEKVELDKLEEKTFDSNYKVLE